MKLFFKYNPLLLSRYVWNEDSHIFVKCDGPVFW